MSTFKKVKQYFGNLYLYLFADKKEVTVAKKNEIVYFDINKNIYHRHLFNLVYWLLSAGFTVKFKYSTSLVKSFTNYSALIFRLKNVSLSFTRPKHTKLTFTDSPDKATLKNNIYLNNNYFNDTDDESYHVPLGMHPLVYFKGYYTEADKLRYNTSRNIRILFSGNVNKEFYGSGQMENTFGKVSRYRIYKILKENFDSDILIDNVDRDKLYNSNYNSHVIFNNSAKYEILIKDYFPVLSKSDFYLFCPGVTHPLCHNNFEAMAVGCIPILQYPEYFYPGLEHGVNCIVFEDEKDLVSKIRYVLTMTERDIAELRKNVNKYYDLHLAIDGVINNISISAENGINTFYIGLD